jgi:hypothetical protein
MPHLNMSKTILLLLLASPSLSAPTSTHQDSDTLLPRAAAADCFATTFGIEDFKSFAGSATLPPTVSFGVSSDDHEGRFSCSRAGKAGSTSPYFADPVRCNTTAMPNFFFSYPEDGLLRIHEVENGGASG